MDQCIFDHWQMVDQHKTFDQVEGKMQVCMIGTRPKRVSIWHWSIHSNLPQCEQYININILLNCVDLHNLILMSCC